jgi:signal peptidase II
MRRLVKSAPLILLFFLDILAKQFALKHLGFQGFFVNTNAFKLGFAPIINSRLAFNIPAPQIISTLILLATILVLLFYLFKTRDNVKLPLSLILIGAVGNFIDRIFHGGVVDFISIKIANFYWPTFNFADIFIVIGVIWLLSLPPYHPKP